MMLSKCWSVSNAMLCKYYSVCILLLSRVLLANAQGNNKAHAQITGYHKLLDNKGDQQVTRTTT